MLATLIEIFGTFTEIETLAQMPITMQIATYAVSQVLLCSSVLYATLLNAAIESNLKTNRYQQVITPFKLS